MVDRINEISSNNLSPERIHGSLRRRSSIFPSYLRRKSTRKVSVFQSESTKSLWLQELQDKLPSIFDYRNSLSSSTEGKNKFGWINGVYVRTVLNIWGVMLFLRMGWMVGNAGIWVSLAIIFISTLVTFCTTLSMSAICTNGEVGTGGIYYMISRSLGAEAGSIIGIIFSFANAVLVSLNLVGAAETAVELLSMSDLVMIDAINDTRIIAAILLTIVAIIPLVGMEWEAKAMFVFLLILLVSLLDYLIGTFIPPSEESMAKGFVGWKGIWVANQNFKPRWDNAGISEVFGVFFPSVIGIFAGASMSGDLRDPNAAIPKGTFLAIGTTSSVYALLIIFLGCTVAPYASGVLGGLEHYPNNLNCSGFGNSSTSCQYGLIEEYQTMTLSAAFGPIIYAGIFAASISSALGSYVCAPRIFQALCEDDIFPYIKYFAKGYGEINDPRRGYVLTYIIALIFIAVGELNEIAPIISNFFIASFFLVNIACFHASFVGSTSFRPTFKYYNQWVSLLSAMGCIGIMFFLSWYIALITVVLMGIILLYVMKKGPDPNWGSSKRSQLYNSALSSTLRLNYIGDHIKNFVPSILLLTGNPSARMPIVDFANTITKNKSLLLIGHIIDTPIKWKTREKVIASQYQWMAKRKVKGFYLLHESASLNSGTKNMIQISGLGRKLRANILMLGYKSSWQVCLSEDLVDYFNVIWTGFEAELAVCIFRIQEGLDYADFFDQRSNSVLEESNSTIVNIGSNIGNIESKIVNTGSNIVNIPTIVEPQEMSNQINKKIELFENHNNNTHNNIAKSKKKRHIEALKALIPRDAVEAMNQFCVKQKKGTIDIWWLTNDGGLTILIPYILSLNDIWMDCRLRILSLTKTGEEIAETQESLTQLLLNLRIPCYEVKVFAESDIQISDKCKDKFKELISQFMSNQESTVDPKLEVTVNQLSKFEDTTSKHLKIRDLLIDQSFKANLIVMTLPLPSQDIPLALYMSWLEILSEEMPPFLFVRGTKKVLLI